MPLISATRGYRFGYLLPCKLSVFELASTPTCSWREPSRKIMSKRRSRTRDSCGVMSPVMPMYGFIYALPSSIDCRNGSMKTHPIQRLIRCEALEFESNWTSDVQHRYFPRRYAMYGFTKGTNETTMMSPTMGSTYRSASGTTEPRK